jgi:hypothetical protein
MTVDQIDAGISALVTALGSGELKVRFSDGREVTYNSAADISARLQALRRERDAVLSGLTAPGFRMRSYPVVLRAD